jgi:hypothetical protein
VLVCAVVLSGCFKKMRDQRDARQAAENDPLSELNLARYTDEIMPLLEEEAGRTFQVRPQVRWLDAEAVAALAADEIRQIMITVFPDITDTYREDMAQSAGSSLGGVLGKYTPATHEVHIARSALVGTVMSNHIDESQAGNVVRLILAHELAHALQNEAAPFETIIGEIRDDDALDAWRATEEGHATWLEEQVARRLDLGDEHRIMTRMQGWEPDGELANPEAFSVWSVYGQGRNFIDWHAKKHDSEHVWDLITHPPPTTAMVFRPGTYSAKAPPTDDLSAALEGTMNLLTSGREWSTVDTTLGEMTLRGEAIHTDTDELERILGHVTAARTLKGMLPGREAEVRVLRFEDDSWPRQYIDLLRRENLTETQRIAAAMGVPVTLHFVPFEMEGLAFDDALKRVQQVPIGGGRYHESEVVWVARNNICVVIQTDFRAGLRTGRALNAVFNSVEANDAGEY